MTSTSGAARAIAHERLRGATRMTASIGTTARHWRWWGAVATSSALLLAATPAVGQTSDPAAARTLFNDARKLTSQGH